MKTSTITGTTTSNISQVAIRMMFLTSAPIWPFGSSTAMLHPASKSRAAQGISRVQRGSLGIFMSRLVELATASDGAARFCCRMREQEAGLRLGGNWVRSGSSDRCAGGRADQRQPGLVLVGRIKVGLRWSTQEDVGVARPGELAWWANRAFG
ncbi:hypothetical protein OR16_14779 [Cupriavidus basilensis OR16]|uniref:Uncharacterized protein n=1 Tax=Cupriavidus basilensis OR16 TaxID=1127483 RepID=H1S550_9BURK|nr:hypothetical protein OR16_14779 [Cupriavidus basilensis OR16]